MTYSATISHRFCVAPMMDWTDRHCRAFHRILSRHALLYTEMITSSAIKYGRRDDLLGFSPCERPVALQLGGCDPAELALAAGIGEEFGYAEINLNCGCPSARVQEASFGAALMSDPLRVADCVAAMRSSVSIPVTVKCRLGVDEQPVEEPLDRFLQAVEAAGCATLIVHARKAWLKGLSPRDNRNVPPLDYSRVYRLKRDHPQMEIVVNGGIGSLDEAESHLQYVDGVMLGRAAYEQPYLLSEVDRRFFASARPLMSREQIIAEFLPYVAAEVARGTPIARIARHMLGIYHGAYGGRRFRRTLAELSRTPGAGHHVLLEAMAATRRDALQAAEELVSQNQPVAPHFERRQAAEKAHAQQ